jgi:tetratricopeptide (TPR) repeat protein
MRRSKVVTILTVMVVPVALLLAIEGGLRLVRYGHSTAFTVPCTIRSRPHYCDNDRFTWQFFPPGAFRLPAAFAIPAEKSSETFRIFVVGESAAEGDPEPAYSFARYLEVMLRESFPKGRFEVINAGIAAINSHALLPVTRDLARHDPDLFVLYLGHNEVVGPFGRGTSLGLTRAALSLGSTRLGQLLTSAIRAVAPDRGWRSWRGMETFLEQPMATDAPALARIRENFRINLRDMVEAARSAGARVLVSTVGANLKDSAPFASAHRAGLDTARLREWDALVAEGARLEAEARYAQARARYLAAEEIDAGHAELQFRLGRTEWAMGRFAEAKQRFERARELDVLRFRADSAVNAIVRSVARAAGPGVELVDGDSLLAGSSPHGVPGAELFYEHVHLRPEGNYVLARELFPRIVALLPGHVRAALEVPPPSQAETERWLALTRHDRRRVARTTMAWLRQAPFTNQLSQPEQLAALRREGQAAREPPESTAAAYRAAIAAAPDDRWLRLNFGAFLEEYGELAAAAVTYRRALEILPNNYSASDKLAHVLARMGKYEEAIAQCRDLLARMPYHPTAYMTLGYALAQTGKPDESIESYERALELHPPYALEAYTRIGIVRQRQGDFDRAVEAFRTALAMEAPAALKADLRSRLESAMERQRRSAAE